MSELPEPMTPPECDLRGMPYMPLDLIRLFDSDLYALSTGDEFKAALTLWGKSFYQVPAGSLPSDDRLLEHLSGSKRWKAVREMALRGWVKCSDGRLYHRTVAEKVAEAWESRLAKRARTEAARAARHKAQSVSDSGNTPPVTISVTENVAYQATEFVATPVTESKGTERNGTEQKGKKKEGSLRSPRASGDFAEFWEAYPRKIGKGQAERAYATALRHADHGQIMAALRSQRFDGPERFIPHPATWLNSKRWLDEAGIGDPVLRAAGLLDPDRYEPDPRWGLLQ